MFPGASATTPSAISPNGSTPAVTRQAAVTAVHQAKRHKAFDDCRFIGLALDGTGAGRSHDKGCDLCRPYRNQKREILGYHHKLVMISVVGTGLTLPLDVEPYGPGDSEYSAGRRLLRRAARNLGRRFADYVVVDGDYATAPFLHDAGDLGLFVVARLKKNLPFLVADRTAPIAALFLRSSGAGSIQGQADEAAVVERFMALGLMNGGDRRLARDPGIEPFREVTERVVAEAPGNLHGAAGG